MELLYKSWNCETRLMGLERLQDRRKSETIVDMCRAGLDLQGGGRYMGRTGDQK